MRAEAAIAATVCKNSKQNLSLPNAMALSDTTSAAPEGSSDKLSSPTALEMMRKFSETYAQRTGTYFCQDLSVTAVVVEGLAKHKDDLGAPLCPCRHYEDKAAEVKAGYWNCPCVPMRERKECHCMLFLTEDNPFAGKEQAIPVAEIEAVRQTMA